MSFKKKVSIIIPCYNSAEFIQEAVESAINQTYSNIEIIIVDDGSIDNTNEIIKSLANKYKQIIFLSNKENKGVVYSRNLAIDNSNGEYILPLDSDDIIDKTYVEKAVKILNGNPEIGIVYCEADYIGAKTGQWNLREFNKKDFIFSNCIFCTSLFRKESFYKAGKFKENMEKGLEDWDLWLSLIELGYRVYRIPEVLFHYRQHKEGSRTSQSTSEYENLLKQVVKNHPNLYLDSEEAIGRIFLTSDSKIFKKYKKYKKLTNIFMFISSFALVLALILIILICFRG